MTASNDLLLLCVERGDPSAEELAALVAVLTARAPGRSGPPAGVDPAPEVRWRRIDRAQLFSAPRSWRAFERVV